MSLFEPKTTKNQGITTYPRTDEQGSIIVWIFIMIVLFAALGYALSQGTRTGEQNLSEYQLSLAASEILEHMGTLKEAVRVLKIEGCEDTDISFENTTVAGYANAGAPADKSCHVFDPNGAGLSYRKPNPEFLDSNFSAQNGYGEIFFSQDMRVVGLGCDAANSDCQDLVAFYPFVSQDVCLKLNEMVNNINSTPKDLANAINYTTGKFTGTYTTSNILDGGASILDGHHSGCFEGDTAPAGGFHFYQVLISR
ncbi:MAG: hypothetical protein R3D88_06700 [Alphaproteobacteria bacterium]|nr:hypothetical protein [Alphaproteobacteria bacterium]